MFYKHLKLIFAVKLLFIVNNFYIECADVQDELFRNFIYTAKEAFEKVKDYTHFSNVVLYME